jgi:hypothetical protein
MTNRRMRAMRGVLQGLFVGVTPQLPPRTHLPRVAALADVAPVLHEWLGVVGHLQVVNKRHFMIMAG